jgi:hypothetical protein
MVKHIRIVRQSRAPRLPAWFRVGKYRGYYIVFSQFARDYYDTTYIGE